MQKSGWTTMASATSEVKFHDGVYWHGDRWMPRVSWVLQDLGICPHFASTSAAQRGTTVHKLCEYAELGAECQDEALKGYVEAYRKFYAEHEAWVQWQLIEEIVYPKNLAFAGRVDRASKEILLDIKTGSEYPFHKIQLSAYSCTHQIESLNPLRTGCLYLKPSGEYQLSLFDPVEYATIWKSCLRIWWFRQEHGLNMSLKKRLGG